MTTNWNGPPLPRSERQARDFVKADGQDDSQITPSESNLQFMRRRAAGLEQLNVILDDLAERGLPICTATAEAAP